MLTLPELWSAFPGWAIHNASCIGGCCEQYEAVYEAGTVQILIVRSSLRELARRLNEVTDGGTLPPQHADLRRRALPAALALAAASTGATPPVQAGVLLPRKCSWCVSRMGLLPIVQMS